MWKRVLRLVFSYVQIGQSSGVLSASASTSGNGLSVPRITVNHGTTVVITSFIPSEPTLTVSTPGSLTPYNSQPTASMDRSSSFWDSTGKVAGVFVAVGLVIAILTMAIFWMWRNRKNRKDEEKPEEPAQIIVRQMSGKSIRKSVRFSTAPIGPT